MKALCILLSLLLLFAPSADSRCLDDQCSLNSLSPSWCSASRRGGSLTSSSSLLILKSTGIIIKCYKFSRQEKIKRIFCEKSYRTPMIICASFWTISALASLPTLVQIPGLDWNILTLSSLVKALVILGMILCKAFVRPSSVRRQHWHIRFSQMISVWVKNGKT